METRLGVGEYLEVETVDARQIKLFAIILLVDEFDCRQFVRERVVEKDAV